MRPKTWSDGELFTAETTEDRARYCVLMDLGSAEDELDKLTNYLPGRDVSELTSLLITLKRLHHDVKEEARASTQATLNKISISARALCNLLRDLRRSAHEEWERKKAEQEKIDRIKERRLQGTNGPRQWS